MYFIYYVGIISCLCIFVFFVLMFLNAQLDVSSNFSGINMGSPLLKDITNICHVLFH